MQDAGLAPLATIVPLGRSSNRNLLVTTRAGDRLVLRRYVDKPGHSGLVRLRRERWASDVVRRAGAPVPLVFAFSEEPGAVAALLAHAEGEHLGDTVSLLAPHEAERAWRSCGRAFAAAHRAERAVAGWGNVGISDPRASRGRYHFEQALEHLGRLDRARPDLRPLDALRRAVLEAEASYERAPTALCQWDAHLWQFLVAPVDGKFVCTALLDWEDADFDDPDFDLAQLDGFRFASVGAVPPPFFEGYGRTPTSRLYALYRLERAAWILAAHAEGADWLELSVPPAEELVRTWGAAAPTSRS